MELAIILIIVAIMALLFFFLRNHFPDKLLAEIEKSWVFSKLHDYSSLLVLVFCLAMVVSLFGRVTAAKWNINDDHEIMLFLGPDGKLPPSEILKSLSLTEVGALGSVERFRPSYYLLRISECALCGANPACWYTTRLILLWLGLSLIWLLILPRLGWLGGGMLCAYILTFAYWLELVGKLGPGETYAVLGLPLYIWGVTNALRQNTKVTREVLAGLALFLGSVTCMGSKENFLLLAIPSAFVAYKAVRARKYYLLGFATGSLAFALFVGGAVIFSISHTGTDYYANTVSPLSRFNYLLESMLYEKNFLPLAVLLGLTTALAGLLLVRGLSSEKRKTIFQIMLWFLVLLAIYCSQIIFYNGAWPAGNRYDFPGLLYIPVTVYLLYILAEKTLAEGDGVKLSRTIIRTIFVFALALVVISKGYARIILLLEEHVKLTNEFTNGLNQMSTLLKQNPDYALVLESTDVWEYEPIFSYQRFLRAYGVENPFFLRIQCYSPETIAENNENPLKVRLAQDLSEISVHGKDLFLPLSRLEDYQNRCFSLALSNAAFTECPSSGPPALTCRVGE
jgi:hypothetical protein